MPARLLLFGLFLVTTAAAAEDLPKVTGTPPERISQLLVYGNDPCPRSSDAEIVVCARQPESERYRVPKRFRGKPKTDVANSAWGARSLDLEYVGRAGLPNSCSTSGSNGQTGCFQQFIAQARAERQQAERDAAQR